MLDFELITDTELEEAFAIAMMSDDELDEYIREHEEQDFFEEDWTDGYSEAEDNMPCDTYGLCAGIACPRFFNCH